MKFRWTLAPAQPLLTAPLARDLGLPPLLVQCLINRGHSDADSIRRFLAPRLARLADPFLLPDMCVAVDRLIRARNQREHVVIFGDYDVDGVTSTALLMEVLPALGWRVDPFLPLRLDEGYGLSRDGVEKCLAQFPAKVLLAVDCGSTAVASIDWLNERGVDTVVLDHHQISVPPPRACALVNPQSARLLAVSREDAPPEQKHDAALPFAELCSAGLAFKLAHALVKRLREQQDAAALAFDLKPLLDLVALGSIADIVPLTGENRILVPTGLERLNRTRRPGLLALKAVSQIEGTIGTAEVGFQLAPRLNAAGRLENADAALRLLLAADAAAAEPLALALDAQNRERQKIERGIAVEVAGAVRARFNPETDFCIVEGQLLWHIGVVGIVASRVLQEFYRPTVIFGGDNGLWRGSGRSIEGFDLAAALRGCDDLLVRHGGHAMAAGVTIRPENVDAFRERLNQLARKLLRPDQLMPPLRLDAVARFSELTLDFLEALERLKPHGSGNPGVNLMAAGVTLQRPPQRMGRENQHAKLHVTDGTASMEAVWWNCAGAEVPGGTFDLAFAPQINEYNGRRSVQLKLLDWRPSVSD